jgi:hypothetical protein
VARYLPSRILDTTPKRPLALSTSIRHHHRYLDPLLLYPLPIAVTDIWILPCHTETRSVSQSRASSATSRRPLIFFIYLFTYVVRDDGQLGIRQDVYNLFHFNTVAHVLSHVQVHEVNCHQMPCFLYPHYSPPLKHQVPFPTSTFFGQAGASRDQELLVLLFTNGPSNIYYASNYHAGS